MQEKIEKFLNKKNKEIAKISEQYPEKKSLFVDYNELFKFDHKLAEELHQNPDDILEIFEGILLDKVTILPELLEGHKLHIRFYNLPREKGYTIRVKKIAADHVGKLIAVDGIVNKCTDVLPKVFIARFYCNSCGQQHDEPQLTRFLREPPFCNNCKRREFRFVPEESRWTDIQRLEIQEPLELMKGGEEARRIEIWLEDDLVDLVTAGDRIIVTGIVRLLPPKKRGSVYYKFIEANHVEGIQREFEDIEISKKEEKQIKELAKDPRIYDKIIGSIAPGIYGYNEVKEAIVLQLFSGRSKKFSPEGTPLRSDIHILLIGDPGAGKSRILQYVDNMAPKSIYVSGKGATGAGLTATAEKDEFAEGAWTLKAGVLVLASGGIAAIDEFDKMSKEDRSAMHEAMEQQTVSIAKAGIVTKFLAKTAILAASNPIFGRFDEYKPIGEQFDIPPTLASRFDLIFPIRDIMDKEKDARIAEHIIKMHKTEEEIEEIQPEIPPELFRKYIAYSKKNISPLLSDDAAEKIKDFYVHLRTMGKGTASATPRQLEALIRLSEASAKVRLSNTVTVSDAERAIELTNFVLKALAYDESIGGFDIDRIITSHPKSDRDKIRTVEEIIHRLISESGDGTAFLDDMQREAAEKGIDKFKADKIINELKLKGIIYEPRHNHFMFTEE